MTKSITWDCHLEALIANEIINIRLYTIFDLIIFLIGKKLTGIIYLADRDRQARFKPPFKNGQDRTMTITLEMEGPPYWQENPFLKSSCNKSIIRNLTPMSFLFGRIERTP